MVCFDDEHQLEQSTIGESLFAMIKDGPIGFEGPARHVVKDAMEDSFILCCKGEIGYSKQGFKCPHNLHILSLYLSYSLPMNDIGLTYYDCMQ